MKSFLSRIPIKRIANCRGFVEIKPITEFNHREAAEPLIEKYRPTWPDSDFSVPNKESIVIPQRTIPEEKLTFEMKMSMDRGSAFLYPHMPINPADAKVKLWVGFDISFITSFFLTS